ncbi:MAG: hypothetical protein ABI548_21770 [Polyangiaceae bacterium]
MDPQRIHNGEGRSALRVPAAMPRRLSRGRRTLPTVEHLLERFDQFGKDDAGYRRLTMAVRRAVRRLLRLLDDQALARYMDVEEAMLTRDAHCNDAVAQWAYSLGYRDGSNPMPRVRVRKRAVAKLKRLRAAPKG